MVPEDLLGRPVRTAAELDDMTAAQRQECFDASVVTDLSRLPGEYLAQLRADAEQVIADRDRRAREDVRHAS